MDYVSSTYLISINCFRMLRLMNKKDSGLFGGPESETEKSVTAVIWLIFKKQNYEKKSLEVDP